MEGSTERAWRQARSRCSLLGHLRTRSDLADCASFFDPFSYPQMAKPPTRLCHGLSPDPCGNAAVHAFAPGIQTRRNVMKDTRTQVGAQCVWTKASRSCMEQIHGPVDERNRFQAEFLRFMPILSREHRLFSLHRRLHYVWSRRSLDRRGGHGLASVLPSIHH